jgi:SAM-dependent methyltransferase
MNNDLRHFENLYGGSADPWGCDTRWYERRKRALLLAALPRQRYALAYEPACGNGALTAELALRCDRVLAGDASAAALAHARQRLASHPHVQLRQETIPREWLAGPGQCDLIIISEIAYYLPADALEHLAQRVHASLSPGGDLVACHWRGYAPDRMLDTGAVHARLGSGPGLRLLTRIEQSEFLLDTWTRGAPTDTAGSAS